MRLRGRNARAGFLRYFRRLQPHLCGRNRTTDELLMSGNLRQVGSADGKVRVKNNGPVVAGAGDPCCCATPCTTCAGTQGSASIVKSGTCGTCRAFGTATFVAIGAGTGACEWLWLLDLGGGVEYRLKLDYCARNSKFYAVIDLQSTSVAVWGS